MGAPVGNQNARKQRIVSDAFRREIAQRDLKAGDGETVRAMAAAVVDKALAGDLMAFREFRDTMDGKPAQEITGKDGGPLVVIQATAHDEAL